VPIRLKAELERVKAKDTFGSSTAARTMKPPPHGQSAARQASTADEEVAAAGALPAMRVLSRSSAKPCRGAAEQPRQEEVAARPQSSSSTDAEPIVAADMVNQQRLQALQRKHRKGVVLTGGYAVDIQMANARLVQALAGFGKAKPMMASYQSMRDVDTDARGAWMTRQ
jgi:hypothetical protein